MLLQYQPSGMIDSNGHLLTFTGMVLSAPTANAAGVQD